MDFLYYERYINWRIRPDIRKPDLSTLFRDKSVLKNLIDDLAAPFIDGDIDVVMGPESLGFVLGGAVAYKLGAGFVAVRKDGRLPSRRKFVMRTSFVDYTGEPGTLEIGRNVLARNARVLIVDDWIDTGGQVKAITKLVKRQQGDVVGISCLAAYQRASTRSLFRNYNLHAILTYDSEEPVRAMLRSNESKDLSLLYQDPHRFE